METPMRKVNGAVVITQQLSLDGHDNTVAMKRQYMCRDEGDKLGDKPKEWFTFSAGKESIILTAVEMEAFVNMHRVITEEF
jgi:hypothetical protein